MNQVRPPSTNTPASDHRAISASVPSLTGRNAELSTMAGVLQGAAAGHGSTVIGAGESGIGKTRLATAVVELAQKRNFNVALGRSYPVETGVPYAVFSDAMLPMLRAIDSSSLSLLTRGGNAELAQLFPAL